MTNKHSITPPSELIFQWWQNTHGAYYEFEAVTKQAAQWGADQELEAVLELLREDQWGMSCTLNEMIQQLRATRRPDLTLSETPS